MVRESYHRPTMVIWGPRRALAETAGGRCPPNVAAWRRDVLWARDRWRARGLAEAVDQGGRTQRRVVVWSRGGPRRHAVTPRTSTKKRAVRVKQRRWISVTPPRLVCAWSDEQATKGRGISAHRPPPPASSPSPLSGVHGIISRAVLASVRDQRLVASAHKPSLARRPAAGDVSRSGKMHGPVVSRGGTGRSRGRGSARTVQRSAALPSDFVALARLRCERVDLAVGEENPGQQPG